MPALRLTGLKPYKWCAKRAATINYMCSKFMKDLTKNTCMWYAKLEKTSLSIPSSGKL
jgi:hypothetical protein